jgi:hypothetical protein
LAEGSFLFGFYKYEGCVFQKYSPNFEFLWESIAPYQQMPGAGFINSGYATELANGDFVCTGFYYSDNSPFMIWLGKMDSTGCWYDAGCSVATESKGEAKMEIKVYPNPAQNYVTIQFSKPITQGNIKIYNTEGKLIFENKISDNTSYSLTIPVMEWANGVYFLIINDVNGMTTRHKVVVLR